MLPYSAPPHGARTPRRTASRRGARFGAATSALVIVSLLIGVVVVRAPSTAGESGRALPLVGGLGALADSDEVAYPLHAAIGTVIEQIAGPPPVAAMQWVKAAAHASDQADLRRAAYAIAAVRMRAGDDVEAVLCAAAAHGSPRVQVAVALGGAGCAPGYFVRAHVPEGTPIEYGVQPPIGGPHYDAWHPAYGVSDEPIPAGRWLHNLEHGAVVLLYNCHGPCPALVKELRALYTRLPLGRNARSGRPRLLGTPYRDMERSLAVVAWGRLLELDSLDPDAIVQFYLDHVDRGPECRSLSCPE